MGSERLERWKGRETETGKERWERKREREEEMEEGDEQYHVLTIHQK